MVLDSSLWELVLVSRLGPGLVQGSGDGALNPVALSSMAPARSYIPSLLPVPFGFHVGHGMAWHGIPEPLPFQIIPSYPCRRTAC
ncbi:uncharacterized protein BO80DRAFT_429744 [Aspergillus ibericus CBS 121593]|uniref:Uncharacterized protein n=1 Tax=Aspergillus ibericus CBS 121593 TaxID=1448316 RepID=A0A395GJD7_9EURO|nr:hypothetical protein BO80DRAFT_429744 [Aspergillus ibericus CBS 121593]RAK95569.1 hypothetical protein BO80DRAFT_429744 [Aspergillus ibericus CBS 121593]